MCAAKPDDPRKVRRVKGGFKLDNLSVRGVVPTISSLFYPEYKYADATQGQLKAKPTSVHPVGNGTTGQERGRRVDEEITFLVNALAKFDLKPDLLASLPRDADAFIKSLPTRATKFKSKFRSLMENMHPFTRNFFKLMHSKGWAAVAAQVNVASGTARVGTAIDVVVADASGKHILLEIKCGYYTYLKRYSANMHKPYQKLTNCPLNQFMLQLEVGRLLYRRQFRSRSLSSCFVVVLHEYGTNCYALSTAVTSQSAELWKLLVMTASQNSRQRQQVKTVARQALRRKQAQPPPPKPQPVKRKASKPRKPKVYSAPKTVASLRVTFDWMKLME